MKTKPQPSTFETQSACEQPGIRVVTDQETFDTLAADIFQKLPLSSFSPIAVKNERYAKQIRQKNRRDMVSAFMLSMRRLREVQSGWDRMIDGMVDTFVWKASDDRQLHLYREKLEETLRSVPRPSLELVDPLCAEMMAGSDEQAFEQMSSALRDSTEQMMQGCHDGLARMRIEQMVGTLQWFSHDVCKYDFYRVRRIDRTVGESRRSETQKSDNWATGDWNETETTYRIRTIGTFDVLEQHVHHLYNADRHQFPAPKVRQPFFIQKFMATIPETVRPHIFVTEGDMLKEGIDCTERLIGNRNEEQVLSSRTVRSGRLYSPSVSIGSFVLTGWSGADMVVR